MALSPFKQKQFVKVYHGYGHTGSLVVCGHVFKKKPYVPVSVNKGLVPNFIRLLQLFFVKPVANARVRLRFYGQAITGVAREDGFFRIEWQSDLELAAGWHEVAVDHIDDVGTILATGAGRVFVPHITQYAFVSDIDDTVLKSYSATVIRRLYELLVRPSSRRRIFVETASHYRLLSQAHTTDDMPNPLFYVSSSEWNLYDYLGLIFSRNQLPEGIFMLNRIKRWFQLFTTGKTAHEGKLEHISRMLNTFPKQQFILLGDNSQQDPFIYKALALKHAGQIYAVYIRDVRASRSAVTRGILKELESLDIYTCLFLHSTDAVLHGKAIGLIDRV